ncbi:MAG: DNA repair exonuclease [Planctomycetota bacterium]|nr:MAG: DNA repair exonuclease [Planctomycetota bacterium]
MAKESFRFIHASDLHLEQPLQDILDLPDHLRRTVIEAPWKAAEAVFEYAVVENVDFVVLAGDILNPAACGAQGVAFLLEQFETLRERNIAVFWAGGRVDGPDRWPDSIALPDNVHLMGKDAVEAHVFRRSGEPIATILGRSSNDNQIIRAAEYAHDPDGTYVIAVAYGEGDADTLAAESVDYWALGGRHQMTVLQTEEPAIRYCGTPQARRLQEEGGHGFLLVDVDAQDCVQVRQIEVDLVRYTEQDIDAEDQAMEDDLKRACAKRVSRLLSESHGRHLLVQWRVQLPGEPTGSLSPATLQELLHWLRREFGQGQPACWSLDIEVLPPRKLPDQWQQEDTILGDFLRIAEQSRKKAAKVDLQPIIDAETPATKAWQVALAINQPEEQAARLAQSTLLGIDLLRGRKVDLLASTRRFGGSDQ